MASFLDYVGIEYESPYIVRGRTPSELSQYFHQEHDASIETPAFIDEHGQIYTYKPRDKSVGNVVIGTEFVSVPIQIAEFNNVLKLLIGWLNQNGEPADAPRCGIHFHISMAYNLPVLKNLVNLARYSEQIFFYIGGMGREFRGVQNDFTYCRPITQYGPSVVPSGNSLVQVFNTEDLLRAQNTLDFFDRYGGLNEFEPAGKYHPVRYGWITFYPLLTKHTVEFRVFNKTTTVPYLISAFELCKAFLKRSMGSKLDLPENSIYTAHDKEHVLSTFRNLATLLELNDQDASMLETIIRLTPPIEARNQYMHTHLRNSTFAGFRNYAPSRTINQSNVARPTFVDIHTLGR